MSPAGPGIVRSSTDSTGSGSPSAAASITMTARASSTRHARTGRPRRARPSPRAWLDSWIDWHGSPRGLDSGRHPVGPGRRRNADAIGRAVRRARRARGAWTGWSTRSRSTEPAARSASASTATVRRPSSSSTRATSRAGTPRSCTTVWATMRPSPVASGSTGRVSVAARASSVTSTERERPRPRLGRPQRHARLGEHAADRGDQPERSRVGAQHARPSPRSSAARRS